ncbi:MAG: ABC transporter ATP-binding protein [Candidatus Hodarchaeales archaeon]|jgi:ABC-2 type transport system ATP-binding protein
MPVLVSASHLKRRFTIKKRIGFLKSKKESIMALDDVSFDIRAGEMFGLLGPNGAGKTTTAKILCTLLYPDGGTATVDGFDVVKDADKVRPLVNMAAGAERMLYFRLTGRENLKFFADLYNIPKLGLKDKIDELLSLVGLEERADNPVEQYSKGMKQRLQIARALINDPIALFLDEPTLGLDVHVARDLRRLIREKVERLGIAVLLTTHYLHEADELCDHVGIIHEGRILTIETPEKLKHTYSKTQKIQMIVGAPNEEVVHEVKALPGIKSAQIDLYKNSGEIPDPAWKVILETTGYDQISSSLRILLKNPTMRIYEAKPLEPSLEDVFVDMIDQAQAA